MLFSYIEKFEYTSKQWSVFLFNLIYLALQYTIVGYSTYNFIMHNLNQISAFGQNSNPWISHFDNSSMHQVNRVYVIQGLSHVGFISCQELGFQELGFAKARAQLRVYIFALCALQQINTFFECTCGYTTHQFSIVLFSSNASLYYSFSSL